MSDPCRGLDNEQVRLPTHAPPLHPETFPCLAQIPSSVHTLSLKVLLPELPQ